LRLQQLEHIFWAAVDLKAVVTNIHHLLRHPVGELAVDDGYLAVVRLLDLVLSAYAVKVVFEEVNIGKISKVEADLANILIPENDRVDMAVAYPASILAVELLGKKFPLARTVHVSFVSKLSCDNEILLVGIDNICRQRVELLDLVQPL
jgi:hypothetical protein